MIMKKDIRLTVKMSTKDMENLNAIADYYRNECCLNTSMSDVVRFVIAKTASELKNKN